LGTVQFGVRYGIANVTGQPDATTVADIIAAGWKCGLRSFDTAQGYGASEAVLGEAFAKLGIADEVEVISKLAPEIQADDPAAVEEAVRGSLHRLTIPRLSGLMLHREAQLDSWESSIRPAFDAVREAGLIERAGVSVYSAERAIEALANPGIDMIQVAANVFDRRMQRAGVFERAGDLGKTVFIRSVYLQGLALMSPDATPARIPLAAKAVAALDQFCRQHRADRRQFAIGFVRAAAPEARLVLGAETQEQVEENCALFAAPPIDPALYSNWNAIWPGDDDELIDPRNWPA
jgi:aryl-alcohol dehydrogenase-like predicted oxidoreductase